MARTAIDAFEIQQQIQNQVQELVAEALRLNCTFGFAESCTGGLVSSQVTKLPGVSKVYNGSIVAYSNSLKERLLNVGVNDLKSYGAVSSEVAKAMASGALPALGVDFAISLTGIAGPEGGTPDKPVGLVWFGFASSRAHTTSEKKIFSGTREQVQLQATHHALTILKEAFKQL